MKTYASNDELECVVGGPIAVVGSLQARLKEETKRADENFASYERIKEKYSATVKENKQLRNRVSVLENAIFVAAAMAGPSKRGNPAPIATRSIYMALCAVLADGQLDEVHQRIATTGKETLR